MNTIDTALQFWTLTNAQHLELIRTIAGTDARVLGTAVDRTGEPVVGVAAIQPLGAGELHLLISLDTGRIVASETYTLTTNELFPAHTVISYTNWTTPLR